MKTKMIIAAARAEVRAAERRVRDANDELSDACSALKLAEANLRKASSWFCDPCKVEVYERRCSHCGKRERDAA